MIVRCYFIASLNFAVYLMIVNSYDNVQLLNTDNNTKIFYAKLYENVTELHAVRQGNSSGALPLTTTTSIPSIMGIQGRLMPPLYINTSNSALDTLSPTATSIPSITEIQEPTISPTYIITGILPLKAITSIPWATEMTDSTIYPTSISTGYTTPGKTTNLPYNPDTCPTTDYIRLSNGTCIRKVDAQMIATSILQNKSDNATVTAHALSLYISSISISTTLLNNTNTLSVNEINHVLYSLDNVNLSINSNTSFIMVQQPHEDTNGIILGAAFTRGIGGEIIDSLNQENVTDSFLSAAGIVSKESLNGVTSFNMLIINKPTGYEYIDNSTNKTLVSSVIVASLRRNDSILYPINISLYFNPLEEYKQNGTGKYLCSFYNTNNSGWDETGCTNVQYSQKYNRYECSCNHLTSFALIWLPESLLNGTITKTFNAQDIASLVFQCISIICFLAIIIHAISVRILNSLPDIQVYNLLPLISTATTTMLFIFFIALSMTVYTQTSSSNETQCFLSSTILMFITYFFLIFMFCVKTCVGYFYYLRFVRLFPQPSHRKLFILIIISFFISLLCVGLAIGFNTKSSYHITQLYPYQLCWFTRNVIYYFLIIPAGLFLLLNIISIILVSKSTFHYACNVTTSEQMNKRLKRCVIVLLSSCVTQSIGWLFGPLISFISPVAGNVLGWIFDILNGLEGAWSIILYVLIRSEQMDKQKHVSAAIELLKSTGIPSDKDKKSKKKEEWKENDVQVMQNNAEQEKSYSFHDLRKRDRFDFSTDDDRIKISF